MIKMSNTNCKDNKYMNTKYQVNCEIFLFQIIVLKTWSPATTIRAYLLRRAKGSCDSWSFFCSDPAINIVV